MPTSAIRRPLALLAATALVGGAAQARAQAVSTAPTVGGGITQEQALSLSARLDALERQNQELRAELQALKAQGAATQASVAEVKAKAPKVTLENARPTLASADGEFTAAFRGVIQLDAAHYDQDPAGPLSSDFRRGSFGSSAEAQRAGDLGDGALFRRVRLGLEGKAWGDWGYGFMFDFGGGGGVEEPGRIINAYLEYTGFEPVKIRAGAFAPATGFEDATSSNSVVFLERPSVVEIVRAQTGADGRTALAFTAGEDRWSLAAVLTGNLVQQDSWADQVGFIGRGTFAPLKTKDNVIHLGASANLVLRPAETDPATTPIRLRDRPELRVDGTRLIDTGSLNTDGLSTYGLEFGAQHRAFSVQAEHFWLNLDRRDSALSDPDFTGWYVQAAWTLTGQPRRYAGASGGFDTPRVSKPFSLKGGTWGAWELAARYSEMDLNYRAGLPGSAAAADAIRGGVQEVLSLGLNWYPNNNVRFMADYQHVDVDRLSPGNGAFGAGVLTPPAGAQVGQDLSIWSLRTQYAF